MAQDPFEFSLKRPLAEQVSDPLQSKVHKINYQTKSKYLIQFWKWSYQIAAPDIRKCIHTE